jgi:hypothetical protein
VKFQEFFANCRSRFEEISANSGSAHTDHVGYFRRIVALKVYQVEDFSLTRRKPGEEMANELGDSLAVDSPTGIRGVDLFSK